jgi:hypothetical protein
MCLCEYLRLYSDTSQTHNVKLKNENPSQLSEANNYIQ